MSAKLICYLSNGYPTAEKTIETAAYYVEGGCDIIEIDIPNDDAYMDSDLIAGRMRSSWEKSQDYDEYFNTIKTISTNHPEAGIIVLLYEKTVKDIGVDKFISKCLENDTKDLILVGIENDVVTKQLMAGGLKVSSYVPFHLPDLEVEEAKKSNGFVYLQAKPAGKVKEGYETLDKCIAYLREQGIDRPMYCGVGVSTKEDMEIVSKAGGDAAFVGSAVLTKQDNPKELVEFIKELKEGTR